MRRTRDLFRRAVVVGLVVAAAGLALRAQQPSTGGRALAIEDYYRIQAIGSPAISPDGTWVSFTVSTRIEDDNSTRVETWVVPADGSSAPLRLTHYGRDVSGARWSDDSRVEYTVDRQLWTIDPRRAPISPVKVGAPRQGVGRGGRGAAGGGTAVQAEPPLPSPDGKWVAAIVDKSLPRLEPDPTSDFERRLTDVNRTLLFEVALSKAERLQWRSPDGTPIDGWLLFPFGYDAKKGPYSLVVVSHGGPHAAAGYTFDFKQQFFAASGYFVLDTNFRSSTGYGEAFKWATPTADS